MDRPVGGARGGLGVAGINPDFKKIRAKVREDFTTPFLKVRGERWKDSPRPDRGLQDLRLQATGRNPPPHPQFSPQSLPGGRHCAKMRQSLLLGTPWLASSNHSRFHLFLSLSVSARRGGPREGRVRKGSRGAWKRTALGEQQAGASRPRHGQGDPGSRVLTLFLVPFPYASPRSRRPLEKAPNPAGKGPPRAGEAGVLRGLRWGTLAPSAACWVEQRATQWEEKRITELLGSTLRLCTRALPAGCESVPGNLRRAGSRDAFLEKWD